MAKTRIIENQSVIDAVVQYLGTAEASFDFCIENGISITEDLQSNTFVTIPESIDKIVIVSDYFAEKSISLATGYPLIESLPIGIGQMIIETNFIVT